MCVRVLQIVLTGVCFFVCVFVLRTDMQTALYELCWQGVQGHLKLDLASSVLGDMMVNIMCREPWGRRQARSAMSTIPYLLLLVRHGRSLYMFSRDSAVTPLCGIPVLQCQSDLKVCLQELREDMASILADVFSILGQ